MKIIKVFKTIIILRFQRTKNKHNVDLDMQLAEKLLVNVLLLQFWRLIFYFYFFCQDFD